MTKTSIVDLLQEKDSVIRLRQEWETQNTRLNAVLRECNRDKHSPPANYWQDENMARRRYETARNIYWTLGGTDPV